MKMCLAIALFSLFASLLFFGACENDGSKDEGDGDTDTETVTDTDTTTDAGLCPIDAERVYDDLAFLASEDLAGRVPGTEGNEIALQRAEDLFADLGLTPAGDDGTFRQAFDLKAWSLDAPPAASIGAEKLRAGEDFEVLVNSGSADLTAEVVFVGYGLTVPPFDPAQYPDCPMPADGYDDYAGVDVGGKIALIVRHGPGDDERVHESCPGNEACNGGPCLWSFAYKSANARLHGASAVFLVQNPANGSEHMRGAVINPASGDEPAALFVDRDVMEAAFPSLGEWIGELDSTQSPRSRATGTLATLSVSASARQTTTCNVLGAILGTDPVIGEEVIVVGGHIDHIGICGENGEVCLGADDNASGAAVTMELARALKACANPARTILFALWNAEEQGLIGSTYYAQNPTFPMGKTIAAYSIDMVGAGVSNELALCGASESQNAWLAEVMSGAAVDMGFTWEVTSGLSHEASDHAPFALANIPAVAAISGSFATHPNYHTPLDNMDDIVFETLEMSTSLMVAGLKPIVEGTEGQYISGARNNGLRSEPAMPGAVGPASRDK